MAKIATRDKTIQTRVSGDEFKIVEEKANFLGLSISNYLRLIALHTKIDISIETKYMDGKKG